MENLKVKCTFLSHFFPKQFNFKVIWIWWLILFGVNSNFAETCWPSFGVNFINNVFNHYVWFLSGHTGDGSTSNESRLARPMSPEAGSNRRCSSVPRTLRERQALNNSRATAKSTKNGNTFGEKLQNFFNSNSKASKQSKTVSKSTP